MIYYGGKKGENNVNTFTFQFGTRSRCADSEPREPLLRNHAFRPQHLHRLRVGIRRRRPADLQSVRFQRGSDCGGVQRRRARGNHHRLQTSRRVLSLADEDDAVQHFQIAFPQREGRSGARDGGRLPEGWAASRVLRFSVGPQSSGLRNARICESLLGTAPRNLFRLRSRV